MPQKPEIVYNADNNKSIQISSSEAEKTTGYLTCNNMMIHTHVDMPQQTSTSSVSHNYSGKKYDYTNIEKIIDTNNTKGIHIRSSEAEMAIEYSTTRVNNFEKSDVTIVPVEQVLQKARGILHNVQIKGVQAHIMNIYQDNFTKYKAT